jgi:hypothetical protein
MGADVDRMKSPGTYVYCLVAAPRRPAAGRLRTGPPGAGRIRLIPAGEFGRLKKWLVVSDVPLDQYDEEAINQRLSDLDWVSRAAVAHESVVESFISAPALLPMKLLTIFTDDARAAEHIERQRSRVDAALKRVLNHDEWGVRLVLDRARIAPTPARVRSTSSGSGYLAGKKAQRDATAELATRAREVVAAHYDRLAALASDAVRRSASELPMKGGPLLLDAAFLVPRTRTSRFRTAVARQARALGPSGYIVTLSGPWPPYSFMRE